MKHYLLGSASLVAIFTYPIFASALSLQETPIDPLPKKPTCLNIQGNLMFGSTDTATTEDVTLLQQFLQEEGYLKSSPTGFYGNLTRTAVKDYQNSNGIPSSGYLGPITRAKMRDFSCGSTTPPTGSVPAKNGCAPGAGYSTVTGQPCTTGGNQCTAEAKVCSDGSTVSRTGPSCSFAPCPDEIRAPAGCAIGNSYSTMTGQSCPRIENPCWYPWNTKSASCYPTVTPTYPQQPGCSGDATYSTTTGQLCPRIENPTCADADVNQDGKADSEDAEYVKSKSGLSSGATGWDPRADLNRSLSITAADIVIAQSLLTQCSSSPYIGALRPASGTIGTSVTISGSGFTSTGNVVRFDGLSAAANISSPNGTTLTFTVPSSLDIDCPPGIECAAYAHDKQTTAGTYQVSVRNANGTTRPLTFTVKSL